jgi:ABC-type multidrug transport system, ATPase component
LSENILEIKHLQKSFGKQDVLKDINITVPSGKIIGLLGKNGAGKTTMIKCLLGLLRYSGEIFYDGKPIDHSDTKVMNSIGALVDTAFFEDMSALDNMKIQMMSTPNRDNSRMKEDILNLLRFVGLESNSKDKVKGFSFGMKQRLALAQTLISDSKLLILDEPFVGLDPLGIILVKEKLIEMCRQKQTTVIFSSHQLSEVKDISELLVVIENGGIRYSGTYDELAQQNKQYRIILDKPINETDFQSLTELGVQLQRAEQEHQYTLMQGGDTLDILLRRLCQSDYTIKEIIREDKILESLFV